MPHPTVLLICQKYLLLIFCLLTSSLAISQTPGTIHSLAPDLEVEVISEHVFLHRSYLDSPQYGRVPCNGMVSVDSAKALIFDTPTTPELTGLLLDWLQDSLKVQVLGVVVTHFHEDCLGGLAEVHRRAIPSIAHRKTQKLAKQTGASVPEIGFVRFLDLEVGGRPVVCKHLGEAHTVDNIVVWLPLDQTLFGGCMVKSVNAGKGNLNDANVAAWPTTLAAVKAAFPQVTTIIPGHGAPGGPELLDYSIQLFLTNP